MVHARLPHTHPNEVQKINMELCMAADRIVAQDFEVASRLDQLGLSAGELIAVVQQKANFVLNQPLNAAGQLSYIYATGALRDVLRPKGWQIDRAGNVEATFDPTTGIKIVFQNADSACEDDRDKAISEKGPAASRAVDLGQRNLFPEFDVEDRARHRRENAPLWYFFVHINGDDVRAELSFPKRIEDGQFKGFNERIYVIKPGEWTGIMPNPVIDDSEPTQEFEINVTRKT
ncbi:hypothetical protein QA640_19885 [Bradyrhizobium sp. CB82]|uniref:hypothetical protein n=1 Tax=Bradyrhizobium sp. CB82 TaxID=3039159 RepID=UPI0024B1DAD0|nr:hypothetical protein [Bradyrhizobium sp. CB82]WFU44502.1 hypothetical protein QA640_19885 [Bradyrhizobium sp. CB82]